MLFFLKLEMRQLKQDKKVFLGQAKIRCKKCLKMLSFEQCRLEISDS